MGACPHHFTKENAMFKQLAVAASVLVALTANAAPWLDVQETVELRDGSTVYVFADGIMGMEDRYGRTVYRKPGTVFETRDGSQFVMRKSQPYRVDILKGRQGGGN